MIFFMIFKSTILVFCGLIHCFGMLAAADTNNPLAISLTKASLGYFYFYWSLRR